MDFGPAFLDLIGGGHEYEDDQVNTALIDAVLVGDVDAVAAVASEYPHLIDTEYGQLVWSSVMDNRTPMHAAAEHGHAAVVETLHRLGSKALDRRNRRGWTPMHVAAQGGHVAVVETLVRLGSRSTNVPNKFGRTPLHVAAQNGHAALVTTLYRLHPEAVECRDRRGGTAMHVAAMGGHAELVATLHRLGSALDMSDNGGQTPMHVAAGEGHVAVVETLHRLGSKAGGLRDLSQSTPAQIAAIKGHAAVLETLMRFGCSALDRNWGDKLMRSAFQDDNWKMARLLLAVGVDPAPLADQRPEQVCALLATPVERLAKVRYRLNFSMSLLDVLLLRDLAR